MKNLMTDWAFSGSPGAEGLWRLRPIHMAEQAVFAGTQHFERRVE